MGYTVKTRSFIGKGSFYIKANKAGAVRRPIGNVLAASFKIDLDKKELPDYESAGGGNADTMERVKSMFLEMETSAHTAENLAIALRGGTVTVARASITDEEHGTPAKGEVVILDNIPDLSTTITVKDGTDTLTKGTDYTIKRSTITMLKAATTLLKVSYTAHEATEIHALTDAGTEYEIYLDGLNEVDSGNPFSIRVWRGKFSPTDGMDTIGDDFGKLKMTVECLRDESVIGEDESKFVVFKQVNTAA